MRNFDRLGQILVVFAAALLLSIDSAGAGKNALAAEGEKLYTQFSFFYEGDHHITTTYRKGILVPINT